jgi:calcium permeable stress-gated cation channel
MSLAATSVLCLFWSIPMAFFSSLTEVNSLKENLPKLGELTKAYPALESFLALIAPLLLLSLNELVLPFILKAFATWEGHVGASLLEASLFIKLCAFVVSFLKPGKKCPGIELTSLFRSFKRSLFLP